MKKNIMHSLYGTNVKKTNKKSEEILKKEDKENQKPESMEGRIAGYILAIIIVIYTKPNFLVTFGLILLCGFIGARYKRFI